MKRAMRCHDFGSGREASRRPYREYGQGERQGGAVTRLPQARLREWRPSPRLILLRHPQAPVSAPKLRSPRSGGDRPKFAPARRVAIKIDADFVGRLDHAPRTRSRAAWCGQGRQAACGGTVGPGLQRMLPQTGLRLTSRSRRDMLCAVLRFIIDFDSQRTRVS